MSFKQRENGEDWLGLADLSMGGFIIFLVLFVVFLLQKPKENPAELKKQLESLKAENQRLTKEIKELKEKLGFGKGNSDVVLKSIADELRKEADKYDIEVLNSGAIRFRSNEELFASGSAELTASFRSKLQGFLALYFKTIAEHKNTISEIRIEGHTDTRGDYMQNLKLSQERAYNVLVAIRQNAVYKGQDASLISILDKSIIANGYSYAKALDSQGQFINESKRPCDLDKSRRVEFKIFLKPFNE